MAKRIMRLTESDLVRLVRKVVKEQFDDNDFEFNTEVRDDKGDLEHLHSDWMITLKGKSAKQVQRLLSNLTENIKFLAIIDCEYADFSDVNLCEFPNLRFIHLKGTPNNLEETQDECYNNLGPGMFDFNSPDY
jgi:hypothetical protein